MPILAENHLGVQAAVVGLGTAGVLHDDDYADEDCDDDDDYVVGDDDYCADAGNVALILDCFVDIGDGALLMYMIRHLMLIV